MEKPTWIQEFEALPRWGQQLVRGLARCGGYGSGSNAFGYLDEKEMEKYSPFHLLLRVEHSSEWWEGFERLRLLAAAMTAPWPKPEPIPHSEMTTWNPIELLADAENCGFDQPCHFGYRVESHAVYCHNDAWPDAPRKCHRNRSDFLHEDCPGFIPLKR